MKILNTLSDRMERFADKKYILSLLGILVLILVLMEKGPFGTNIIRELSGGIGMLDMQYGYRAPFVYDFLGRLGEPGQLVYLKLLGLDFLFAVVYMSLQGLLVTVLIRKAKISSKWKKLNLIPFLRSLLDFLENGLLIFIILSFPAQHAVIVTIASLITMVKLAINYGYIGMVFFLGALITRQSALKKNQTDVR